MRYTRLLIVILILLSLFTAGLALAQESTEEPAAEATAEPVVDEGETAAEDSSSGGLITALRHTHSFVRWIVILLTVAALLKLGIGFFTNAAYDTLAHRLMLGFTIGITLQWLIGIVYFVVLGAFNVGYRWEHAVIMTIAVGLAHMNPRWKNAPDKVRYRNGLIIIVVVLALVFVGVLRLPYGWRLMPV